MPPCHQAIRKFMPMYVCGTWWCDVQEREVRGWMQMVLTPYDLFSWNKCSINFNISNITSNYTVTKAFSKNAHSVHAGSSSSRPTCPSFFFLFHVVPFLAGSWLLFFPTPWGAWPSLTPFPQADPFPSGPRQCPALILGTVCTRGVHTKYILTYVLLA